MKVLLLDVANLAYRYFHAVPPFTRPDGIQVWAVFGIAKQLLETIHSEKIDLVIAADEGEGPTDREAEFAAYKAHRSSTPDELKRQWPLIDELFMAYGIPLIWIPGAEADDIIATLAYDLWGKWHEVLIASGDKDLMQLVNDRVKIFDMGKRLRIDIAGVVAKWGVNPAQVPDLLALMGDTSDNIPWVAGFGPKTAATLLTKYTTLENLLDHAGEITGKNGETLRASFEIAKLSKKLATVKCDIDLSHVLRVENIPPIQSALERPELRAFFEECGFKSLIPKLKGELAYREASTQKTVTEDTQQAEVHDFKLTSVNTGDAIEELKKTIQKTSTVTITTEGEKFTLTRCCLTLDWVEVFELGLALIETKDFLNWLITDFSGTLKGYDLKTDFERIHGFIGAIQPATNKQGSLF